MFVVIFVVTGLGAPAFGHAAMTSSDPEAGATVGTVPTTVKVNYAEPPTTDAKFSVADGCGRDVAKNVDVLNQTITADVSSGQPGHWKVSWTVVSAADGHLTSDSYSFEVHGKADCSNSTDAQAGGATDNGGSDSSSSFPVLPIAVATIFIVGLALVLRARSN